MPWIRTTEDLSRVADEIGEGPLALDLEADSFHHYQAKVCLLQLAFGDREVLVDPLAGLDPAPLGRVLGRRATRKILHGADYDLRLLHRDLGLEVEGLFDTMIAARLTGERAFGLAALVEARLGVRLDKRHQRADWSERPMPADRAQYAAEDVRYLRPLSEWLEGRLRELGRWAWAEEEFRCLEGSRWAPQAPDPDAFLRVKGSGDLDPRGLAVLRELYRFRDGEARERDLPPFKVARDEALVEIVRAAPRSAAELARVPLLSARLRRGAAAEELLRAVDRGRTVADAELPRRAPRRRRRPDPELETRVRALQQARDEVARELDLDPAVVASRALLESLLRAVDAGEPPGEVPGLHSWQAALVIPLLARGSPS